VSACYKVTQDHQIYIIEPGNDHHYPRTFKINHFALPHNGLIFSFTYVFSVIGMSLFRMPEVDHNHALTAAYIEFEKESNIYFVGEHIDPFGSISESMFSLLKFVSGDDWCNFRNNLILA
jgi:voltage-gated sodium channel